MNLNQKTAQTQASDQAAKRPRVVVVETVDGLEFACDAPIELHTFNFIKDDYIRPRVEQWTPMTPEALDAYLDRTKAEHNQEYEGKIPADAAPTGLRGTLSTPGQWLTDERALKICRAFGIRLIQAQEEEVRGRWDWRTETEGSDTSFGTEVDAARNACETLGLADRRVTATFNPQAWINGNAISVDAPSASDQDFDVTDIILEMGKDKALGIMDSRDSSDDLLRSPNAPRWAKDWPGPFFISVKNSIEDYFEA